MLQKKLFVLSYIILSYRKIYMGRNMYINYFISNISLVLKINNKYKLKHMKNFGTSIKILQKKNNNT